MQYRRSLRRWRLRPNPFERSGNKQRPCVNGVHLYNMIMYRLIYPKCTADELRRYMFDHSPPNDVRVFTRKEITDAEERVGFTRKTGSTTAFQFYSAQNMFRRQCFWTLPYPLGVAAILRHLLMDFDECALYLQTANRTIGKAYLGARVREPGLYGHDEKWTLMMCIDPAGFKHVWFRKVAGTTGVDFRAFMDEVLQRLPAHTQRTILMDNLSSHYDPIAWINVAAAGHRFLPRPCYAPQDGPIEYVFNTLECALRGRLYHIRNDADLVREVTSIITNMVGFDNYFIHCGY